MNPVSLAFDIIGSIVTAVKSFQEAKTAAEVDKAHADLSDALVKGALAIDDMREAHKKVSAGADRQLADRFPAGEPTK